MNEISSKIILEIFENLPLSNTEIKPLELLIDRSEIQNSTWAQLYCKLAIFNILPSQNLPKDKLFIPLKSRVNLIKKSKAFLKGN